MINVFDSLLKTDDEKLDESKRISARNDVNENNNKSPIGGTGLL